MYFMLLRALLWHFKVCCVFLCCSSDSLFLNNWRVYSGVVSLNSLPTPYFVERIIINENYNNQTNDQDVALLKLREPVNFDGQSEVHFIQMFLMLIPPWIFSQDLTHTPK